MTNQIVSDTIWRCCVMPRQMGYIHCNYWLHWELSKVYEQLNSFSWNNKSSLLSAKPPAELPEIVNQMDTGVVAIIWFCFRIVKRKKKVGRIWIAIDELYQFQGIQLNQFCHFFFFSVLWAHLSCPQTNGFRIEAHIIMTVASLQNLSEPWSCGTK